MDDKAYESAKAAISEKDNAYFAAHGLADILRNAGTDAGPRAILALVRRLAADDSRAFLFPISAGLREAVSDDDEFARVASGVAATMSHRVFLKPVDEALVGMGKDRPATAAGAASRLVGLGEAYFAAHIIGGAYGGAGPECDGPVERLFSSGNPRDAAAAVRALRIARLEHGSPDAGRIKAAVKRALGHYDEEVEREAMEALVDLYRGGDAAAEGMIESLVAERHRSRPALAAHIFGDSPFDDEKSLRYLRACMGYKSSRLVLHSSYCALAKMAGRVPGDVARMLVWMFNSGWHDGAWAGLVLDELGKKGAPDAVAAILEVLQGPHDRRVGRLLEPAVARIAWNAGRGEVAETVLRAIDGRPDGRGPCLRILSLLAHEDWRDGGGPEFLEGMMSRLCARPVAAAGAEGGGRRAPERAPERIKAPPLPA